MLEGKSFLPMPTGFIQPMSLNEVEEKVELIEGNN